MSRNEVIQSVYTVFDTEVGRCGIVWRKSASKNATVVIGFQLPEATPRQVETRIMEKWKATRADSVPRRIGDIINRVKLHFKGRVQDFRDVELELDGVSSFDRRSYQVAREVVAGQTTRYGEIADRAGRTGAARAVGLAMARNPVPLIIPCHRVLAAGKKPGGFSANGGINTKARMLEIEGVTLVRPASIRSQRDLNQTAALLGKKDPRLARLLSRPIELRLRRKDSPYHTLVTAVVHQQLSPKAAETILGRIRGLYNGMNLPEPAELIKTSDSQLRGAGLSRSKAKSLKDIAAKALDGTIPPSNTITLLSDEAIIRRLTSIYGVGRWTVEMMLIFNLGRMDVFPVDDYALRKHMAETLRMKAVPTPSEALRLAAAWKPYRTVASLYLWNARN